MDFGEKGRRAFSTRKAPPANIICYGKALALYCMEVLSGESAALAERQKPQIGWHITCGRSVKARKRGELIWNS